MSRCTSGPDVPDAAPMRTRRDAFAWLVVLLSVAFVASGVARPSSRHGVNVVSLVWGSDVDQALSFRTGRSAAKAPLSFAEELRLVLQ